MPDSVPEPSAVHDPLTQLPNHRAFANGLAGEFARAGRHGRPLSVAILGLDGVKLINGDHGRGVGDAVLADFARRLSVLARQGELVARLGGDQFAWILPDADGLEAFAAAERVRRAIAAVPVAPVGSVTVSIGISDLDHAPSITDLYARAQQALVWAKHHGGNQCFRFSTETAAELEELISPLPGDRRRDRRSLDELARDADAKHADFADHSNRVASLATSLAVEAGWAPAEVVALHRAALLHDVGRAGVPETVIGKPAALDPAERAQLNTQTVAGADMLTAGFSPDQVAWVRHHHERWDGTGYPEGLAGEAIPEGAQLIGLADAYDAITHDRPYRPRMTLEQALMELRSTAGIQFSDRMVDLLEAVITAPGAPGS